MAPKVFNLRPSKSQPDNVSFKNKRRRKTNNCAPKRLSPSLIAPSSKCLQKRWNILAAEQSCKSPKHRWKLNPRGRNEKFTVDECRMTNIHRHSLKKSKNFQQPRKQQNVNNNSSHDKNYHQNDDESVGSRCENVHHFINTKSVHHDNVSFKHQHTLDLSTSEKKKPQRRDFVNFRKLFEWTTPSSVKKLLPIFILVNMLPFLYAGESTQFYKWRNSMHDKYSLLWVVNTLFNQPLKSSSHAT